MNFKNEAIEVASLPKLEMEEFQKLHPNYLKVKYIGSSVFFIILLFILLNVWWFSPLSTIPWLFYILLGGWLLWGTFSMLLVNRGYHLRGYVLREHDVVHRSGVIFRNVTTIPFNRVQHCEINQGPIQRWFNLKSLQIFTAGGSNSDLQISGLTPEQAERMKAFIVKRAVQLRQQNDSNTPFDTVEIFDYKEFSKEQKNTAPAAIEATTTDDAGTNSSESPATDPPADA